MNIKQHAWSNKVTIDAGWEHKKWDALRHSFTVRIAWTEQDIW
jgi:hypothetical protein